MYKLLRGDLQQVGWKKLICNNGASKRSLFILWLTILGRLPIKQRLLKWSMIADDVCPLCKTSSEDIEHLFFQCPVSQEIWTAILSSLQICRSVGTFSLELHEAIYQS